MKDHPEFIVGGLRSKKNKWQSCINMLIFEFQQKINNRLHKGSVDLPSLVTKILVRSFVPNDGKYCETMYYIACAVLNMIGKVETCSMNKYTLALKEIRANTVSTKTKTRHNSLPMARVEPKGRVELCYINRNPAVGAYMCQLFVVYYYNRVVYQLHNLFWCSGLAPQLIERFGRAHQGSRT